MEKLASILTHPDVWSDENQRLKVIPGLSGILFTLFIMILSGVAFTFFFPWAEGATVNLVFFFIFLMPLFFLRFARHIHITYYVMMFTIIMGVFFMSYWDGGPFSSPFSILYFIPFLGALFIDKKAILQVAIFLILWLLFWFVLESQEWIQFPETMPLAYHGPIRTIFIGLSAVNIVMMFYLKLREAELTQKFKLEQSAQELESFFQNKVNRMVQESIASTEEKERKRVAADLHDSIGPLLSSVKLTIGALTNVEGVKRQKMLDTSLDIINEAIKDVRNISHNMLPEALKDEGLFAALKNLVFRLENSDKIKIHLRLPKDKCKLEPAASALFYRVIEELINNVIKHSEANNLHLHLEQHSSKIKLRFKDDGIGFDVESVLKKASGIGLQNIIDRIHALSGQFEIRSNQLGTEIEISIPLIESSK